MPRKSNESVIVSILVDWFAPNNEGKRGRKAGGKQRIILQLIDKRNWAIGIERAGYPPVSQAYSHCPSTLLPAARRISGLTDNKFLLGRFIEGIANLTKEKPVDADTVSFDDLGTIYKTNLMSTDVHPVIAESVGIELELTGD